MSTKGINGNKAPTEECNTQVEVECKKGRQVTEMPSVGHTRVG